MRGKRTLSPPPAVAQSPPMRLFSCSLRLLAAAVAWLALAGSAAANDAFILREAQSVESDAARYPDSALATRVTLPDEWAESSRRRAGTTWYRALFDADDAQRTGELLGLLIERACSNFEVRLNGTLIHAAGRMEEPITNNCHHPQLIALPAALLRPRENELDLKLAGHALTNVASREDAAGLSALRIGRYAELTERHARLTALHVTLPQMVSATLLLFGCVMFVMGWLNRRESHVAYFGALSIGWALLTARLWLRDLPLEHQWVELAQVSLLPLVTGAAVQFLLRYGGWRSRPIGVALTAQCIAVPLSLVASGPHRMHVLANTWYALLAIELLIAMGFYLWTTRRQRRGSLWMSALVLVVAVALVGLDFVAREHGLDADALIVSHLALPLLLIMVGLRLVQRYGRALHDAEEGRLSLEMRIREATEEIERNFAQLAELRVEQVTERERKRIAADLHDDLGAKLLTIVHTSESERISTLAREALEEMRLSVRGLTGKPVRLIDALGDWRAEVVSRLAQAGVEAEWSAPAEELPQTLSARAYVQTTRILREAVSNIIKHSGASHCAVRSSLTAGDFQLVIQDNGRGIPLELDGRLDRGHGMSSMKHRAKQLQGQCLVESGPGYGTVIRLTLPLERHAAPA
jgi:two-component system sensor histidine kinase UhpB